MWDEAPPPSQQHCHSPKRTTSSSLDDPLALPVAPPQQVLRKCNIGEWLVPHSGAAAQWNGFLTLLLPNYDPEQVMLPVCVSGSSWVKHPEHTPFSQVV